MDGCRWFGVRSIQGAAPAARLSATATLLERRGAGGDPQYEVLVSPQGLLSVFMVYGYEVLVSPLGLVLGFYLPFYCLVSGGLFVLGFGLVHWSSYPVRGTVWWQAAPRGVSREAPLLPGSGGKLRSAARFAADSACQLCLPQVFGGYTFEAGEVGDLHRLRLAAGPGGA